MRVQLDIISGDLLNNFIKIIKYIEKRIMIIIKDKNQKSSKLTHFHRAEIISYTDQPHWNSGVAEEIIWLAIW